MKKIILALAGIVLAGGVHEASAASSTRSMNKRLMKSAEVIQEYQADFAHAIPTELLNKATCITVVPSLIRGGLIFGAKRGRGVTTCRTEGKWSYPTFTDITGASYGFQIGLQETDIVLVWMRSNAPERLSQGNLTLGVAASIAAGPVGRDALASTDYTLDSEIYSYSRSRGAYAGIALDGSAVSPDDDDNAKFYANVANANGDDIGSLLTTQADNSSDAVNAFLGALEENLR